MHAHNLHVGSAHNTGMVALGSVTVGCSPHNLQGVPACMLNLSCAPTTTHQSLGSVFYLRALNDSREIRLSWCGAYNSNWWAPVSIDRVWPHETTFTLCRSNDKQTSLPSIDGKQAIVKSCRQWYEIVKMNPRVKKTCELRTAGNSSTLSVFTA